MKAGRLYTIRSGYDAASRSPEAMRHWREADRLSPDAALSAQTRGIIISRARYECANNGYADGIIQTLAEDTIGTGPRLQLNEMQGAEPVQKERHVQTRMALQRREMRFREWCDAIDLTEKLRTARMAKARDGEVFIRLLRNPQIEGVVKIDIDLYEAEQVGSRMMTEYSEFWPNGQAKEFDGISYDQYGNPDKYRFWRIHPGAAGLAFVRDDSYQVSAKEVIHYAHIVRPGQHRGLSEIASTLAIFNDLRRYTNAVLAAAETAAEISFVLQTDTPADEGDGQGQQGQTLQFMDVVELVRNSGIAMPEGWKANQMKAEHPTDRYVDFVDAKLAEAARPLSMPFAVAKGDCSKSNYASGRLDHQTYHKRIIGERNRIEKKILNRLLKVFESIDAVAYPEDYKTDTIVHSWMWDNWEHVDPVKEATAQAIRLANRTTTLADECAREGKDYELVLNQIAIETQMAMERGIQAPAQNTAEAIANNVVKALKQEDNEHGEKE